MNQCDCCNATEKVREYVLPHIGYGSVFDSGFGYDTTEFYMCDKCRGKINRYIRKRYPDVSLKDFWSFNIVKVSEYEDEFEYEVVLVDVLKRFVPKVWYGDNSHAKILSFMYKVFS